MLMILCPLKRTEGRILKDELKRAASEGLHPHQK